MKLNLNELSYNLRFKKYPRFIIKLLYKIIVRLNRRNIDKEMLEIVSEINESTDIITYACCAGHEPDVPGYIACQCLGAEHEFESMTSVIESVLSNSGIPFAVETTSKYTTVKGIKLFIVPENKEFVLYWKSEIERVPALAALDLVLGLIEVK